MIPLADPNFAEATWILVVKSIVIFAVVMAIVPLLTVVELSPVDAQALGIREGDRVEVGANGTQVEGAVRLRAAVPGGSVFIAEGTHEDPANLLTEPLVEVRRVGGAEGDGASPVAVQAVPAAEGLAEPPASAPLDIPPTAGGREAICGGSEG